MEISYILKMQAEGILNMNGCVVDQKLSHLYMCSNACMLGVKACMHVAHMFSHVNLHGMQLALQSRDRNMGIKKVFCKKSTVQM